MVQLPSIHALTFLIFNTAITLTSLAFRTFVQYLEENVLAPFRFSSPLKIPLPFSQLHYHSKRSRVHDAALSYTTINSEQLTLTSH